MNYEELYQKLSAMEKTLKDSVKDADRFAKQTAKNTETGNLIELKKAIRQLADAVQKMQEQVSAIDAEIEGFDTKEYFVSGDFTRQLLEACRDAGIDVKGDKGVYEMFPYKVRIVGDAEHAEEVWMNRKKIPSYRPRFVSETVKEGQQKLYKAAFNAEAFMNELADAYETCCLKSGARIGSNQTLTKLYKIMTPMARARKEYDLQAFAFDLARLYERGTEAWVTKSGQQYVFGTSRDGKTGIRVLSSAGVETYINTIYPIHTDAEDTRI